MKKVFQISLLLFIYGCAKQSNDEIITPVPTNNYSCLNSTWKYEVILGSAATIGSYLIEYKNEYGNIVTDTTLTSTWSIQFPIKYTTSNNSYPFYITLKPGPLALRNQMTTATSNTFMISIYKNSENVQTTGVFMNFCFGGNPQCNTNTNISKSFTCNM